MLNESTDPADLTGTLLSMLDGLAIQALNKSTHVTQARGSTEPVVEGSATENPAARTRSESPAQ
ncbi:hypothetical protein [Rhodococcus erythropolis]|uniref:hypothetical protein n=1 Tax=Rhodococcus erythropolis TaxID=1833 RepID=UPI00366CB770